MKTKRGVILLFIFAVLLTSSLALAQNGTEVDKAYACLKSQLGDNCAASNSIEQLSFSLIAMGHDSDVQVDCKAALITKQNAAGYWGDKDIKSTAQAILALNHIAENIEDPVEWLLTKQELTEDLDWFLQIDSDNATECEIRKNNGSAQDFEVFANKKVSGSSSCLSPAASEQNYYFKIDKDCLDDEFIISCDEDFITSVFYKRPGDNIYFVSSATHSAPSDGETKEKIDSYCFADSSNADCDYEASLWAALALAEIGRDTTAYLPYLSAEAENNDDLLPSAFLYMLMSDDDYYAEILDQQKQGKFWEEATNQKFYDTALALLALQGTSIEAIDDTKDYLFDVQDDSGCWNSNNILETAFLLYAGWPKSPLISPGTARSDCDGSGFSCVASGLCSAVDTLSGTDYYCPGIGDVCCKSAAEVETCSEKQGTICETDQECSIPEVIAEDTNYCCTGECLLILGQNECEYSGYSCRSECDDDEEERAAYSGDCDIGEMCCASKPKKGGGMGLIILLIILIILVVLAIVFRNQLKVWFFRIKSKFKFGKGPKPTGRPPMPPPGGVPQLGRPRQIIPRQPTRRMPARRIPSRKPSKDSAFDETMKKLKDMTK